MRIIKDLEIGLDEDLAERIAWMEPGHNGYRVLRQSVDARRRRHVHFVYTVEVAAPGESLPVYRFEVPRVPVPPQSERPVVVGSGPAGLFAALRLVERGIPCRLFERGSESGRRIKGINRYWRYGELDPRNNVCYGEGGAGLYSDGKLITRIKSPHIPYVLERLVRFSAPAEIQYLANPHVGSDKIRRVIPKIREFLRAHGCEIHYDTKIEKLLVANGDRIVGVETERGERFATNHVALATGHSAEDMLRHLGELGVALEPKPYALGLRIEHPQPMINRIQYRDAAAHPKLGSANYRLADHDPKTGVGVYSFCMCPGGFVLSSGTEADGIVVNGMSNFHRNSPFANAAIVVSVDPRHFGEGLFAGLDFRRALEREAYAASKAAGGGRELPAQRVTDFMGGTLTGVNKGSSPSGAVAARLDQLLPAAVRGRLAQGLEKFERSMPGFLSEAGQLYGVESRTSCPVRVTRDTHSLQSVSHRGLYPCGEGAGYAGGITSAACDGIRVAEKIVEDLAQTAPPPVADELLLQELKRARADD